MYGVELVRIMNTQKVITTTAINDKEQCISIRRYSEPTEKVKLIYDALGYKLPFHQEENKSILINFRF